MSWIIRNRWLFVPVALLSLTVAISVATVLSAVVGHPLGAEPAYDVKAASWDDEREQRAVNERLRWVVTPEIASDGPIRTIALRIEDKHGVRIAADRVRVECIPVRAAEARISIALGHRRHDGRGDPRPGKHADVRPGESFADDRSEGSGRDATKVGAEDAEEAEDAAADRAEAQALEQAVHSTVDEAARHLGEYEGRFESPIGGQWEFRIEVEQGGVRYTDSFRRFLTEVPRG